MEPISKNRLEAFSDGVIAILITIMVLELHAPHHGHDLSALKPLLPLFLCYALSFLYLGIYWNNHHHLLHTVKHVNGSIMWANLHLLFWLSLFPFSTAWIGQSGGGASWPVAFYGVIFFMAGMAYYILQQRIVKSQGNDSRLSRALGRDWKGKLSLFCYLLAIGLAFVNPWISIALYVGVALVWVVPDPRIEGMR